MYIERIRESTINHFYSSRGYADGEIEALFSKYDLDGDRVLDEDEQKKLQADLEEQKVYCYDYKLWMKRPQQIV